MIASSPAILLAIAALIMLVETHTIITYPGWRGNSLHTNGTLPIYNPNTVGIDLYEDGTRGFPFGMQWMHPCGGMSLSKNRTKWPVGGGALSIQPGWFPGHKKALYYVNLGITEPGELAPRNYSHPVVSPFQIVGPNNSIYHGQFCLPDVRLPVNLPLEVGSNVTIQVIETAQHGAALYTCVDITLSNPEDVEKVTPQNCYNSSDIGFRQVFTSAALISGTQATTSIPGFVSFFAMIFMVVVAFF